MAIPSFGLGMGGGGGGGTLPGAAPSNWSPAWGGSPQVPSPGGSAAAAIGANLSNLPQSLDLARGMNQFNQDAVQRQLRSGLPLYDPLTIESSNNIMDMIQGEVPQDVINQILQVAAERGIITGTTGSENANAAMLRALGLTSLDLMQRGEQNLTAAIGRTPRGPLFDPSKMMVSPDEWQNAQMAANMYRSAPNPQAAGTRALGAAASGLSRGLASGGSGSSNQPWKAAPSWEQASAGRANWADYGSTQAYSNPSLQGQQDAPYDWMASTFGQNPQFGAGLGSGFSNLNYDQSRYFPDPAAGGYWDADSGELYS
jgi:hypothetical protein